MAGSSTMSMPSVDQRIIVEEKARALEALAYRAIVEEVWTSPKPGLVDRLNSGAHNDMDFMLFLKSAGAIRPFLGAFAQAGLSHPTDDWPRLFDHLREIGILSEQAMFEATGGVNTHKGMIFSMAMVLAAAGTLLGDGQRRIDRVALSNRIRQIAQGILEDFRKTTGAQPTAGERLHREHGLLGIRGEAYHGYPSVLLAGLPQIDRSEGKRDDPETVRLNILLALMGHVEDTTIAGRHGVEVMQEVREMARTALAQQRQGGDGNVEHLIALDEIFTRRRISPGGSADLLAITLLFHYLEKGEQSHDIEIAAS